MSIVSIVNKLLNRKQALASNFIGLARLIAANQEPPIEEVERVLAGCGKSPEDLAAEVERIQQRHALKKTCDAGRVAAEKLPAIDGALRQHRQALDDAQKRYDAAVAPLSIERRRLDEAILAQADAERRLWESAPAEIMEPWRSNQRKLRELAAKKNAVIAGIERARDNIASRRELLSKKEHEGHWGAYREEMKISEQVVAERRAELADLEREEAAIIAADAALRAEAMQP